MVDTSTEAVTKLMDGVTPGSWGFFQGEDDDGNAYFGVTARTGDICSMSNAYEWRGKQTIANAHFIAAARDLVPALLAERDGLKAYVERLKAQPAGVWPDFIAPPKYDNPDPRWQDPRLPDFRLIWAVARECGYSIGLHGSMRRDCDMIAAPWTDDAVLAFDLIQRLCTALNAKVVGPVAGKPHGRLGWNLQVDGWVKVIDISVMPRACDRNAAPPPQPITVQDAAETDAERFDRADWFWRVMDPDDCGDTPAEAIHRGMIGDYCVCEIASSYTGPVRFGFTARVLDPESDDTEFLHFATQQEAIDAAKARYDALRAIAEGRA